MLKYTYFVCLMSLFGMGILTWTMSASAGYESAPYEVIESDRNIEVRQYPDLVLASTESNFQSRGSDGSFMRLFKYISGSNESSEKIAMTTPVFMENAQQDSASKMGFVLPQSVAASGPPNPKSDQVSIRKRPGGRFATIRFSGVMTDKNARAQEAKLRKWIDARGMKAEENSERAGYDAPFIPGPLRRNEILIRLVPAE